MSTATLPTTLEAAHQLIEQLQWRVAQLEKELFGPSSERKADERLSKEQILLSLFPAAQPAATQQPSSTSPRRRRSISAWVRISAAAEHAHAPPAQRGQPRQPSRLEHRRPGIFELLSLERLHLDMSKPKAPTPPGGAGAHSAAAAAPAGLDPAGMAGFPLEITCRGPFRFNVSSRKPPSKSKSRVVQIHPTGPNDRLTCNLLTMFFTKKAGRTGAFDLEPQRIEAIGSPAKLMAWTEKADAPGGRVQVEARGEQLQYDLQAKSIALGDAREVFLRRGGDELHARNVHYKEAEAGRLGRMESQGPGWLRHEVPDHPDQQLDVRWNDQLLVRPQGRTSWFRSPAAPS